MIVWDQFVDVIILEALNVVVLGAAHAEAVAMVLQALEPVPHPDRFPPFPQIMKVSLYVFVFVVVIAIVLK